MKPCNIASPMRAAILLLATSSALWPCAGAYAQIGEIAPPAPAMPDREVYMPTDFARFAPRNALDMLNRVPGFAIEQQRTGESRRREAQQRGLGQASENILINGERLSSKADSVADQLARIPAKNVERIELLDGASLSIPGLSGQVANIVVIGSGGISGQFTWSPQYSVNADGLRLDNGKISLAGSLGAFDFTVAASRPFYDSVARGPTTLTDATGNVIETRETVYLFAARPPNYTASIGYAGVGGVTANLNYTLTYFNSFATEDDVRIAIGMPEAERARVYSSGGTQREIGGDVEFDLGAGRLKLIGVDARREDDIVEQAVTSFIDDTPSSGTLFDLDRIVEETIGRAEYSWPMAGLDWQFSGEAAFNTIDNTGALSILNGAGEFVAIPFPGGTGGVSEDRYETILTVNGRLVPRVSFQLSAGAEFSTIGPTGEPDKERSFSRPKGALSLNWTASDRLSVAFELARRVGQLDFGDFLATVSLAQDTQNSANADLVPQQSWEAELEIANDFGRWGNATLTLFHHRISDLVDFIALPDGTAAKGNIESATRTGGALDATIELAAFGWKGARLDIAGMIDHSRLTDPVDGSRRNISNLQEHRLAVDLRHDILGTSLAWGGGFLTSQLGAAYRVNEIARSVTGPDTWSLFAEHKDVFGLTMRTELVGLFGPRRGLDRTVYDGVRGRDPVEFFEFRNQNQGMLIAFSVSGSF